jgi:two-component system KDP operon response regulator KdpE
MPLSRNGLRTIEAASAAEALEHAAAYHPDLVLLDLELPDSDGTVVMRRLREWATSAPILVVSAAAREQDKVAAFDAGANDYLTKPFATGELLARVRVWLREIARVGPGRNGWVIQLGELRIDLAGRLVSVAGRQVHLTPTEYKLFATLMRHPGRVMSHRQLLETTWGPRHARQTLYLRVYIAKLRRKLEHDAAHPRYLLTDAGAGYFVGDVGPLSACARDDHRSSALGRVAGVRGASSGGALPHLRRVARAIDGRR